MCVVRQKPVTDGQTLSFKQRAAGVERSDAAVQVVASFRGRGRMDNSDQWYEGRLWQYADGDIGFLWLLPDTDSEGYNAPQLFGCWLAMRRLVCWVWATN